MKFSVGTKTLVDTLSTVGRAVSHKGVTPILANVLLRTDQDCLWLVGTDLEMTTIAKIPATIEQPGETTIPARLFLEVISNLPVDDNTTQATFAHPEDGSPHIELKVARSKYKLQIQGAEEFPPVPAVQELNFPHFKMATVDLKRHLKRAVVAVGADESNPVHRSVCFAFAAGQLNFVATDTKRLALSKFGALQYPPEFEKNFLVPGRAVHEVLKLIDNVDEITVGLFHEQLVFATAEVKVLTRLYEGRFPDYNRVMPKDPSRQLTVSAHDFVQALRAVQPIARSASMMMRLDCEAERARVWAEARDAGMSEVWVPAKLTGEPIQISFNLKFLQDFLGVLDSDSLTIEMTTPNYPGLVKPAVDDPSFFYVVMPMTA